jgi:hypothetical protein
MIETAFLKQATINCLSLPDLVLAEIKDYLFYDRHASKQIQETRTHKSVVLDKIENAYTREKHTQALTDEYYNDTCKYNRCKIIRGELKSLEEFLARYDWVSDTFTFQSDISRVGGFVIGSNFCIDCGNYTYTGIGNNNLHHRCKCLCMDKDDSDAHSNRK